MTMAAEHRLEHKDRLNQTPENPWGIYLVKESTII